MARGIIPPVPMGEIPDAYRETAAMMNRLVGDSTAIQVFAHSKPVTDFYFQTFYRGLFYNEAPGMTVDHHYKQLLRLRLSKRHGCALCNRANEEETRVLGFSEEQIEALFEPECPSSPFSAAELAIVHLADQMALDNQEGLLDRALYEELRAHFSDEQIVEVAFVAAVFVGAAKFTFVLDIVPREQVCALPQRPSALQAAE